MKKVFLSLVLVASICQVNAADIASLPLKIADQLGGRHFHTNIVDPLVSAFLVAPIALYLKRAGVDVGGQLYRRFKKPTTALQEAQIKRVEEKVRKILALSPILVAAAAVIWQDAVRQFGPFRFSNLFSFHKNTLNLLLLALVGALPISLVDFRQAQGREEQIKRRIALLKQGS